MVDDDVQAKEPETAEAAPSAAAEPVQAETPEANAAAEPTQMRLAEVEKEAGKSV